MNKKVKKKMSLSRETLLNLESARLQEAAGGATLAGTNPCSECSVCMTCFPTAPCQTC